MFSRSAFSVIFNRLQEERRFIQVLAGPRQTGKTTIALQVQEQIKMPVHFASADEPALKDHTWIEQQWQAARIRAGKGKALLILDEIQKVSNWSESVKRLWDEDAREKRQIYVLMLGSSPLLVQRGLTESLAGRFELVHVRHWSFAEMQRAFGWNLDQYIFYGGYPGAAVLIGDHQRWKNYLLESLIETSISRDIFLMARIDKPALLRRLFELGCHYSGQILSYQKMLGQLQDAGNTTTLAHYLDLLDGAGFIAGLHKFSSQKVRQRASSPKLLVQNTALQSAHSTHTFSSARTDHEFWGRLTESTIGAHLLNAIKGTDIKIYYWLERNREVDFVLQQGPKTVAIEVKSSRRRERLVGMELFAKSFNPAKKLLVGADGIPIEEFLSLMPQDILD